MQSTPWLHSSNMCRDNLSPAVQVETYLENAVERGVAHLVKLLLSHGASSPARSLVSSCMTMVQLHTTMQQHLAIGLF